MDDREYQEQKARVERFTERWLIPLRLDEWHVEVCWHREKEDPDQTPEGARRPSMMLTEVRWQYNDATIHVYLPSVYEVTDDERVEMIVVHEMMHILTNELRPLGEMTDEARFHDEHACTMLAKAFLRTREYFGKPEKESLLREPARLRGSEAADGRGESEAIVPDPLPTRARFADNTGPYGQRPLRETRGY